MIPKQNLYQNRVSGLVCLLSGTAIAVASLTQLAFVPILSPVAYVVIAVVALYFVVFRLGRGGIIVMQEGVRVRNPFRTSRLISWDEIQGCVLDKWHVLPDVAFVELRDGNRIPVVMLEIPPVERAASDVRLQISNFNLRVKEQQSKNPEASSV